MKIYKILIYTENAELKRNILYSFSALVRKAFERIGVDPLLYLYCNYEFDKDRNKFENEDIEFFLIDKNNNLETKEFLNKFGFEVVNNLPNNLKLILSNVKVLNGIFLDKL